MSKAPDKIYIQTDMINSIPLEQQEFDDDVVYIRKDALLEWANGRLKETADALDFRSNKAFGQLVEKLQSL